MPLSLLPRLRRGWANFWAAERSAFYAAWAVLLVGALLSFVFGMGHRDQLVYRAKDQLNASLSPYASGLQAQVNQHLALLDGLHAFTLLHLDNGTLHAGHFRDFAGGLASGVTGVHHVTIAPGGVQQFRYPEGGGVGMGEDLLSDERPDVRAQVQQAIDSGEVVISAPHEMRSGGMLGIAVREALFIDGEFWGLFNLGLELQPLLDAVGLLPEVGAYRFALRDAEGTVFFGEADIFASDPVIYRVDLPGTAWELAGVPVAGWGAVTAASTLMVTGSGLIVSLLLAFVVYLLLGQQQRLRRLVQTRTAELADSEARYRALFENAPIGIGISTFGGVVVAFNDAILGMFAAQSREEFTGYRVSEAYVHAERPELMESLQRGEPVLGHETQLYRMNGEIMDVRLNLVPFALGGELHVLTTQEDITERKRIEQALQQRTEQLERLFDIPYYRIAFIDTDLNFVRVNAAFAAADDREPDFYPGRYYFDVYPDAGNEAIARRVLATGEPYSVQAKAWVFPDNPERGVIYSDWTINPQKDADGNVTGLILVMVDATEREAAIDALRASQRRYRDLFEYVPVALWEKDLTEVKFYLDDLREAGVDDLGAYFADHPEALAACAHRVHVLDVNRAALALAGSDDKTAVVQAFIEAIASGQYPPFIEEIVAFYNGSSDYETETVLYRQEGMQTYLRVRVSIAPGYEDTWGKVLVSATDITAIKAAQAALHESQERLLTLINASPDFVVFKDGEDRWLEANAAASDIFHLHGIDYHGKTCREMAEASPMREALLRCEEADNETWAAGRTHRSDEILQMPDGVQRAYDVIKVPLYTAEGSRRGLVVQGRDITRRTAMEQALRRSESRYRSMFEHMPVALWEQDFSAVRAYMADLAAAGITDFEAYFTENPDDLMHCANLIRVLDVNQATQDMVYVVEHKRELLGPVTRYYTPEAYDTLRQQLVSMWRGEPVFEGQTTSRRQDGSTATHLSRVIVPPEYRDTWAKVLAAVADVSLLTHAEQRAREQQALAEALQKTTAALAASLDFDVVLSIILDYLADVLPYDHAAIAMRESEQALYILNTRGYSPEVKAIIESLRFEIDDVPNYRHMVSTHEPVLIEDTRHDERWEVWRGLEDVRSYLGAPIVAQGKVIGFLNLEGTTPGFFQARHIQRLQAFADQVAIAVANAQLYDQVRRYADELEHRVALRTLELDNERSQLRAILESMGEGVIYAEGMTPVYSNRRAQEMFGYTHDELNQNLFELLQTAMQVESDLTPERGVTVIHEALRGVGIWRGEVKLRRKDDTWFDAYLIVTLVAMDDETPASVTLIRDISQEKALEEARERFIANASHELRTPVTNIKTRLYLLRKQPGQMDKHLTVMEIVTARMEALVNDLLDVSRFERGVIRLSQYVVVLQDVIERVLTIQQPEAEQADLTLVGELPDAPLRISIDPRRITQVITNLIVNAIHYTPAGGQITVTLAQADGQVVVQVTDTGIGIPPALLPHIFEPFFRVEERVASGTGLGLTISREIARLHGGDLVVESVEGEGSTFTLTLPG